MSATEASASSSRPGVAPDERSAPFFDGAEHGQLVIMRCDACRAWLAPVSKICTECLGEELSWEAASGRGTVHSFGLMHQVFHRGFANEVPYNVTVVELEEGPRLQTNMVGCANDEIRVGMTVVVTFERAGEAMVPKFRPA